MTGKEKDMPENSTLSILDEITNGASQVNAKLQNSKQRFSQDWDQILSDMDQAADQRVDLNALKDKEEQRKLADRRRIHDANFETLSKSIEQEDKDLTECIEGLETVLASINVEFSQLQKPNREQEARLQTAKNAIEEATQQLGVAKTAWFGKTKKITRAEKAIADAKERLSLLEQQIQKEIRTRLKNTTMDERLSLFQTMSAKAEDHMKAGIKETTENCATVAKYRAQIQTILKQASAAREKISKELDAKKPLFETENAKLQTLVSGSKEFVEQNNLVDNLKAELTDLTGRYNAAQAILEDKMVAQERFAKVQEALQKQLANHRIHAAILRSQMEDRTLSFKNSLALLRNAANEQASKHIHDIGMEIDHRLDVTTAEATIASEKTLNEIFEAFETRMKRLYEVKGATNEELAECRRRFEKTQKRLEVFFDLNPSQV